MCNSDVQVLIDAVVDNKVSGGESFTAFDISLAVANKLKASGSFDVTQHRHRNLKNDVHRSIDRHLSSGTYERQLRDVGAPTDAYVYYPQGGDPSAYVPLKRTDTPVAAADPYTINTATTPTVDPNIVITSVVGSGNDDRSPDARGALCVPSHMLRNAGFVPGDKVQVYADKDVTFGSSLIVVKQGQVPAGLVARGNYTVDSYCNVRITHSVISGANLASSSDRYTFEGDNSRVAVKPV